MVESTLVGREPSPFGVTSRKLGIWMFIVADAVTFAAVLFAYGYMRIANPDWTRPFTFWPTIANGIVMTIVLLTSSLTMTAALLAAQAGRKSGALRWLRATMLLGAVFAALHLREWIKMIGEGWRPFRNPLGIFKSCIAHLPTFRIPDVHSTSFTYPRWKSFNPGGAKLPARAAAACPLVRPVR